MLLRRHSIVIVLGIAGTIGFAVGCGNANTTPVTPHSARQENPIGHDHTGDDHSEHDADIAKAMASLSTEDRAAAERQKMCPVGDEPLGSMGAPIKVSLQGRDVFICCEGCADRLTADPAKFLAKLPQQ